MSFRLQEHPKANLTIPCSTQTASACKLRSTISSKYGQRLSTTTTKSPIRICEGSCRGSSTSIAITSYRINVGLANSNCTTDSVSIHDDDVNKFDTSRPAFCCYIITESDASFCNKSYALVCCVRISSARRFRVLCSRLSCAP